MSEEFTSQQFRQVLGQYPTGVVVVSALIPGEPPAALTIGSFNSVSLEPPLVAFYPSATSSTWPRIQAQGRFCINVLSAEQEVLCRAFAQKGANKFDGVSWRPAPGGAPIIDGAVAWIDCEMESVQVLGDHHLVVGRVTALDTQSRDLPLLFFRGGYGRFLPSSLAASDASVAEFLPVINVIRPELERVAAASASECLLATRVRDEFVVLAGAGSSTSRYRNPPWMEESTLRGGGPTRVGRRLPYLAPMGAVMAAWGSAADVPRWISPDAGIDPAVMDRWGDFLTTVRSRGYALGRGDIPYAALENAIDNRTGGVWDANLLRALDDVREAVLEQPPLDGSRSSYDVRSLSVPIFAPRGSVLQMGLYGLGDDMSLFKIRRCIDRLLKASWSCTQLLGGAMPEGFPRPESQDDGYQSDS
ncbi:flavin reductase family protein (plasmid) [Nocardioides sp. R1-1]|uniref:flavin reductase family protein n=1 Tax=Nocardioides sp. R1-1 TaxID=3383502 RepID=UPI0038D1D9F7